MRCSLLLSRLTDLSRLGVTINSRMTKGNVIEPTGERVFRTTGLKVDTTQVLVQRSGHGPTARRPDCAGRGLFTFKSNKIIHF